MLSIHWFRHWDKIFWVVFIIVGIAVVSGVMTDSISFEFFLILGVFMVIIGAGKLAEEISKHRLVNYQDDIYRKIHQISNHLERTFNIAESYKAKTEYRLHKLDTRRNHAETKIDSSYRDLARKIMEIENRINKVSKVLVERERRDMEAGDLDFSEKVLSLVKQIPRGKVSTYSEIAKTVGNPQASKAIGKVLASNSHLKSIPFHRVVKSNGNIRVLKNAALLRKEGVKVEKGKINVKKNSHSFIPDI